MLQSIAFYNRHVSQLLVKQHVKMIGMMLTKPHKCDKRFCETVCDRLL